MKLTILIFAALATTSAWAVDDETCMTVGRPAYLQMASNGRIDGASLIKNSGMSTKDIRQCLQRANANSKKLVAAGMDAEILRKTIRDLYAALNKVDSGSHSTARGTRHVHSASTGSASR